MNERELIARSLSERLLRAFTSRRVVMALVTVLIGTLTLAVPELQPLHDELLVIVVSLALVLISGMSAHDAARIGREQAEVAHDQLRERVKLLLSELIDEVLDARKEKNDA
jgi:hypothetical protein